MPFENINKIKIYYETKGKGPGLLYISGTGGDLRKRPNIFDSPLSKHFKILSYDQRGQGLSDHPDIPHSMIDYANDANKLLEILGWNKCYVIGFSFGGMVAQELAIRFPSRIEKIVLLSTSSGGIGGSSYPLEKLELLSIEEKARNMISLIDTRLDESWKKTHPKEFQNKIDQMIHDLTIKDDEATHRIGIKRQLEARAGHNAYAKLHKLEMPVYICGGKFDGITSVTNLKKIQNQIPNAHLEIFEGGHMFFLQDSNAFNHILAFLKGTFDKQ